MAGEGGLQFRLAGPRALLVEFADLSTVLDVYTEALRRRGDGRLPAVDDIVPAARTVLFDGLDDPSALAQDLATWRPAQAVGDAASGRCVDVPTVYEGADVTEVAAMWDVQPSAVADIHSSLTHTVAFLGFAPGFAYLAGLPAHLQVPRRSTPRLRVPAGAVGLAGEFTGIYPRVSPGGWQIIGHTELAFFDPNRAEAALLTPGTTVRFIPIAAGAR